MATFTPPTDNIVAPTLPETSGSQETQLAKRLFRHYARTARGRNVWKLTDGTYTESQPSDASTIAITYLGGHEHTVSSTEVTALTTAGYGASIT